MTEHQRTLIGICSAFGVRPSWLGVDDPLTESVVSLRLQRRDVEKIDRRAPGDWAAMAAQAEDTWEHRAG